MTPSSLLPAAMLSLAMLAQPGRPGRPASEPVLLHILRADKTEIVAETVTSPLFGFKPEGAIPSKGLLRCTQSTERGETTHGDVWPTIVLSCDGQTRLVLTGVDLQTHTEVRPDATQ